MNPLIAPIPVLVAIGFAIGFTFNFTTDPYAELSIFLGAISIGLAMGIFIVQHSQNQQISELTEEQHRLVQKIDDILSQQQQNKNSRLRLAVPKIIDELNKLKKSYGSLSEILDHPKRDSVISALTTESIIQNDSFTYFVDPKPVLIRTTQYAETNMKKLFEDIQSDVDRIIMENTTNHPHWAYEHFEFLITNKENPDLIKNRFNGKDFLEQLQHCDFLIGYYNSLISNINKQ
ncbi:MAG: hypothetical protein OEM18_07705 [Nitrosopumilus sp.]|nr:hypothetical protein [Nitrosopumilus sp.]